MQNPPLKPTRIAGACAANTAMITWSDAYLLGWPAMDDTHREFVEVLQRMQSAPDDELAPALDAMAQHLRRHFEQEERWMRDTAFPPGDCHADEHAQVTASIVEVQAHLADVSNGPARFDEVRELAKALEDWFPGHADYMDASLAQWMSKRAHGGVPVVVRRGLDTGNDTSYGAEPALDEGTSKAGG